MATSVPQYVQLQKNVNRRVGDTTYYSWRVTLPSEKVEELGWEEGTELEATVEGDALLLQREDEDD